MQESRETGPRKFSCREREGQLKIQVTKDGRRHEEENQENSNLYCKGWLQTDREEFQYNIHFKRDENVLQRYGPFTFSHSGSNKEDIPVCESIRQANTIVVFLESTNEQVASITLINKYIKEVTSDDDSSSSGSWVKVSDPKVMDLNSKISYKNEEAPNPARTMQERREDIFDTIAESPCSYSHTLTSSESHSLYCDHFVNYLPFGDPCNQITPEVYADQEEDDQEEDSSDSNLPDDIHTLKFQENQV